jgi:poly(3-hydroxybutyrate) depolymerase
MRYVFSIVAFASVCSLSAASYAQDVSGFEARSLKGTKGLTLPYRLFKVQNPVAGTKYPLILFLHGAGERGDDNTSQLMANAGATVWATAAHQTKHAAYVIAPQCPADKQWVDTDWGKGSYSTTTVPVSDQLTTALEIADAVATEFMTDPARQYITGLSMGGYGTWDAVVRNPERFAAALPICGAGDPTKASSIKLLPLWAFHGDADPVVPVSGSRDMVAALMAVGSTVKYTEYPGVQHDAWDMTYANEEVIDWLFQFKKETAGLGGSGGSAGMGGGGASAGGSGGASAGAGGSGGVAGGSGGNPPAGTASGGSSGATLSTGGSSAGAPGSNAGTTGNVASASNVDSGCSASLGSNGAQSDVGVTWLAGLMALLMNRRRVLRKAR